MASKRKLIGFDPEIWQALDLLAKDRGRSMQQLADEAFADLLAKHQTKRPTTVHHNTPSTVKTNGLPL